MAFHYVRDANFNSNPLVYHSNGGESHAVMYHFLRVADFEWLWECDSEIGNTLAVNHVADGNMEAAGTGSYAVVGTGAIIKETATFERGTQSLRVTANAMNDGAQTVALSTLSNVIARAFDAGDTLSAPVNEIVTLYDDNSPFINTDTRGCTITITGMGDAGNNGTFVITDYTSTSTIKIQNPSGVADLVPAGSYVVRFPYEIVLYARNSSGVTWNVDVDQGDAAFVNVGTIPDNGGVWTKYHFSFDTLSNGARFVRFVDPSAAGHPHEIYIDSMIVFRSNFEYTRFNVIGDGDVTEPTHYDQDGELIAPDQFSSADYVPSAKDVGCFLFVWDPAHPKNSGAYKIIANVGGGVVQVDLRSGSAALTAVTGLKWRIVDIVNQFKNCGGNTDVPSHQYSAGYGLQSPHSSKWRFFVRYSHAGPAAAVSIGSFIWAAPEDTAFDMSTGIFYNSGPSTLGNGRQTPYTYVSGATAWSGQHAIWGPSCGNSSYITRTFIMTDDDGSFVNLVHWYSSTNHGAIGVGYGGADPDHPGIEEFLVWSRFSFGGADYVELDTAGATDYRTMWIGGTVFSPEELAVPAALGLLAARYAADTDCVINQTNNGVNPWSLEEVLYRPTIIRDYNAVYGCPSIREITDMGWILGRSNLPVLATFDSANYLHFATGACWEWNGETIL